MRWRAISNWQVFVGAIKMSARPIINIQKVNIFDGEVESEGRVNADIDGLIRSPPMGNAMC